MVLSLGRSDGKAQLQAWFEDGFIGFDLDAYFALEYPGHARRGVLRPRKCYYLPKRARP